MDIQQYIAQQRQAGASDQQIVQMLMSGGWAQRDAETAVQVSYAHSQPLQQHTPAPVAAQPQTTYQQHPLMQATAHQKSSRKFPLPMLIIVGLLLLSSTVIIILAATNNNGESNNQNQATSQSEVSTETPPSQQQTSNSSQAAQDSQRKNTINFLSTELITYAAENNGILPESGSAAWADFVVLIEQTELLIEPSTDSQISYTVFEPEVGEVQYVRSAQCGIDRIIGAASERQFAIMTKLEDGNFYCLDNAESD